ncbi:hypothetical protein PG997_005567 [Apiospora hydei]|uniref:Cytochrome oxidase c assembly-domain-containing protein n=1 Tax=Apiospora hydei TaxID=1337664 RepID=A0ABR1WL88_9PEZI
MARIAWPKPPSSPPTRRTPTSKGLRRRYLYLLFRSRRILLPENRAHNVVNKTISSLRLQAGSGGSAPETYYADARRHATLRNRPAAPETLDEKVRRLRAAHLAAKNHDVSKMDKVIGGTRRYMDAAHRFTVMGLIGFSGLALVVTVYATVDMMMYNRKRRNEFFAMQQTLQSDSLDAARLAYMTGKASDEQIAMVEDATERAKQAGVPLPKLLNPARTAATTEADAPASFAATSTADKTVWPGESMQGASLSGAGEAEEPKKKGGLSSWLFSGLKKEDTAAGAENSSSSSSSSLNFKNEEAAASGRVMRAIDEQKDNVKAALETERENQRKGGPLDQIGLNAPQEKPQKKGWFW